MMQNHMNIMRRESMRANARWSLSRMGIVSAYDPEHYAAKVRLQPEDVETGFLPIATLWAGNGWGMFAPPVPGDTVDVHFQEGSKDAAYIAMRHYGDVFRPLAVPAGEFWLVHESGSFLKFLNNGDVGIHAAGKVIGVADEWHLTGNMWVTGDITATGEISDHDGEDGNVGHIRTVYNTHTHNETESVTLVPNQPL